jgi:hypothetical protein
LKEFRRRWTLCRYRHKAHYPPVNSGVPTAAIQFAHDVGIRSRSCDANTIVRWTDVNDRGGHFAIRAANVAGRANDIRPRRLKKMPQD